MKLAEFRARREPDWTELAALLATAGDRPQRLGPTRLRRLGALYRSTAADLAFARRRYAGDQLVGRLERLVIDGRAAIYGARRRKLGLVGLFARDYWRLVAERPRPLAIAAALLVGPTLLAAVWGVVSPEAAVGIVPAEFQPAVDPGETPSLGAGEGAGFSTYLFTHNVQVTFLAFAAGIFAGVATAALLIQNGVMLGAIAGIAIEQGQGGDFIAFVAGHGVLELSCIVVTAAAGLRLGWSLVEPGPATRAAALAREARNGIVIVAGTAPWLVLAGLLEAFVRGNANATEALAVGVTTGALFWGLMLALGCERSQTAARALARR